MFKIKAINPLRATVQELRILHECMNNIWAEEDGVRLSFKEFCEASKNIKKSSHKFNIYLLFKSNKAIGRLVFQVVQKHDDQDVVVSILKKYLDSKVLLFLDKKITCNYFEKMSWLKTFQPDISLWSESKGFKVVNQFQHFEKSINSSIKTELEDWAQVPDNLSVHYISYPEGKYLSEFTSFMNICLHEMMRENVRENLRMKKNHVVNWIESAKMRNVAFEIVALRDEKEKMVAMSFGILSHKNPKYLQQRMTGVLKEYRGQNLGITTKSLLYLKVKKDYPTVEVVKTDCFTTNKPMYAIQIKMGFHKTIIADELLRESIGESKG